MTTLIAGATGATGHLLVKHLLDRNVHVKAVVRSPEKLPASIRNHRNLTIIHASILDIEDKTLAEYVKDCDAVASCLGHNLTFKGLYGHPRKLVRDATQKLCTAIKANQPTQPTKFILMNTAGNRNLDLSEPISFAQHLVIGLVRLLVPPHSDNEQAADYLRTKIGQNNSTIEWVAVRPDDLINEDHVTDYDLHPSPIRSAIFDAGKTSRINVAHFMADLTTNERLWSEWKGQMPIIYNADSA